MCNILVSGLQHSGSTFVYMQNDHNRFSYHPLLYEVNTCFMYLGAPMLDTYIFIDDLSSCWIDLFIII